MAVVACTPAVTEAAPTATAFTAGAASRMRSRTSPAAASGAAQAAGAQQPTAHHADLPARCLAQPTATTGYLTGPAYRYGCRSWLLRTLDDWVAIPAGIPHWPAADWLRVGILASVVTGLMAPTNPSPDVRFDRWTRRHLDPHVPDIWITPMQLALWGTLGVGGAATWIIAAATGQARIAETMSLTLEAVTTALLYHLVLKLSLGREGPGEGSGRGELHGPVGGLRYFPAGTPSGHFATLYAMLAVGLTYWQPPWPVVLAAHAVVAFLAVMHVLAHRHYLSDVVWGASIGYYVGQWVVRQRSTRYRSAPNGPSRITLLPWTSPDPLQPAYGMALQLRFL